MFWVPRCGRRLATSSAPRPRCGSGTATVLAWKGETLPKYWWRTEQILTVPGADGCDQLDDDGGDATILIHKDTELEAAFADDDGTMPDPENTRV